MDLIFGFLGGYSVQNEISDTGRGQADSRSGVIRSLTCYVKGMIFNKYDLYERSVQSAKAHVNWFVTLYKDIHGKYPRALREDFCGTFKVSCEWVNRNRQNTALALDLDPEPLQYGRRRNMSALNEDQKNRLKILKANVLEPTSERHDLIYAGNFSFYIFKKRAELLRYFQGALKSLRPKGTLILELAGGPGMICPMKEQKTVTLYPPTFDPRDPKMSKKDYPKFVYIWDQKGFNPITHDARYAIHFKLPNGKMIKNAFEYDWRLWTMPETRDLLHEAGFSKTYVYWETEHKGQGTGEFVRTNDGDNAYSWIGYLLGVR